MSENSAAKKLRDWWIETGMIKTFGPDFENALDEARSDGYSDGWNEGYSAGYDHGFNDASDDRL